MDEKELTKARAVAEEQYSDLTTEQIQHLRRRAKNDLFFLSTAILEYDLLSVQLHGHYCRWLEGTRGERFRIKLIPRGHYKTTIDTISESIQIALPNEDAHGQIIVPEHPWTLGPDVKILIEHETREGASRALYEISEAFLRKPLMLALFPELVPSRGRQRINKWELELPRRRSWKEPTFDAIGIGGAEQGRHYHKIKLDDIIGKEARDSRTVMMGVIDTFDNINSLMTRPRFDGFDLTGTRWSLADVYAHALLKYGLKFAQSFIPAVVGNKEPIPEGVAVAYIRGAIENGIPIFREEFTLEDLAIIMKNKKVWNAQYANNPLDDDLLEFSDKWLKFYNVAINGDLIVFEGKVGRRRVHPRNLDRVVLVDPSMGESPDSDETGIVVTGTDNRNNIYILETVLKRLRPPEFIKELFRLYTKYWPRTIAIEKVNFSGIYAYWFKAECDRLKVYPNISDYSPGTKRSKEARVRGLANYGAAGQIYCLEGHTEFRNEWEKFGAINKYHLLDALAQGPDIWRQGPTPEDVKHVQKSYEIIEQSRSPVTGY